MIRIAITWFLVVGLVPPIHAQHQSVQRAQAAFSQFDFPQALALAREALTADGLTQQDLAASYEVIGFSLGALDSADAAVGTLAQMIVLDPEREPNTDVLPPRLVNLYSQAFSQVLVVRHVLVDSTQFVGGFGRVTMHYEVSRPSIATISIVGNGINAQVDSQLVDPGNRRFDWDALIDGQPVPPGRYQVIINVEEGRNGFQSFADIEVRHAAVDTVPHATSIEGFDFVPETRTPPRDWRPLGMAALLTGLASGSSLALSDGALGGPRRELIGVSVSALAAGVVLSLRKPEPQPVPEAVMLNALIRQELAERNRRIAEDNEDIRRRVRITVVQLDDR